MRVLRRGWLSALLLVWALCGSANAASVSISGSDFAELRELLQQQLTAALSLQARLLRQSERLTDYERQASETALLVTALRENLRRLDGELTTLRASSMEREQLTASLQASLREARATLARLQSELDAASKSSTVTRLHSWLIGGGVALLAFLVGLAIGP